MTNNKPKRIDWFTSALIAVAFGIVVLLGMKFFQEDVIIPDHRKIKNWETLYINTPIAGSTNAPVKIIEFYSYGCGFCRILHHSLTKLQKNYQNRVSISYKPLHMGNYGLDFLYAIVAHCADRENKFKKVHKFLFQFESNIPDWKSLARKAKITKSNKFVNCIKKRKTASLVQQDELIFDSLQIRGVPYMIINGKGFLGSLIYPQLEAIVKQELNQ